MKSKFVFIVMIAGLLACSNDDKKNPTSTTDSGYNVPVGQVLHGMVDFNELLHRNADEVVLVNFYTAACSACRHEAPFLNRLAEEYVDRVVFLALSVDKVNTLAEAQAFADALGLELPVFLDKDQEIFRNLTQQFYPTNLFYGRDKSEDPMTVNGAITYSDAKARLDHLLGS